MYKQEIKKIIIFFVLIGFVESTIDSDRLGKAMKKYIPRIIAGIPEYGCDVLDPMCLDEILIDVKGLHMNFSDAVLTGLKDAFIEYEVDFDNNTLYIKATKWPSFFKSKYVSTGVILDDMPFWGDGELTKSSKYLDLYGELKFEVEYRDNKHYLIGKGFTYHYDITESMSFTLSNLYDGDEKRGEEVGKILNKRWQEVNTNYGKPIMDVIAQTIYKNAANFFFAMSVEDIVNTQQAKGSYN